LLPFLYLAIFLFPSLHCCLCLYLLHLGRGHAGSVTCFEACGAGRFRPEQVSAHREEGGLLCTSSSQSKPSWNGHPELAEGSLGLGATLQCDSETLEWNGSSQGSGRYWETCVQHQLPSPDISEHSRVHMNPSPTDTTFRTLLRTFLTQAMRPSSNQPGSFPQRS
jgi:hypothetical protein